MYRPFIHIPRWLQRSMPGITWMGPAEHNKVYLTFDDGPHPEITPWVLSELEKWNAKASFFCIGDNVNRFPEVYRQVLEKGHTTGNHTQHHLNGWKTSNDIYLDDVSLAAAKIQSKLFRPPYGKIGPVQLRGVKQLLGAGAQVVLWNVLSGDFDRSINGEQCAANVIRNFGPGSIIVFHDSEKAFPNLSYALPLVLEEGNRRGYHFAALPTVS